MNSINIENFENIKLNFISYTIKLNEPLLFKNLWLYNIFINNYKSFNVIFEIKYFYNYILYYNIIYIMKIILYK